MELNISLEMSGQKAWFFLQGLGLTLEVKNTWNPNVAQLLTNGPDGRWSSREVDSVIESLLQWGRTAQLYFTRSMCVSSLEWMTDNPKIIPPRPSQGPLTSGVRPGPLFPCPVASAPFTHTGSTSETTIKGCPKTVTWHLLLSFAGKCRVTCKQNGGVSEDSWRLKEWWMTDTPPLPGSTSVLQWVQPTKVNFSDDDEQKQDRPPGWSLTIFIDRLVFLGSSFPHGGQDVAQLLSLSLGPNVSANLKEEKQSSDWGLTETDPTSHTVNSIKQLSHQHVQGFLLLFNHSPEPDEPDTCMHHLLQVAASDGTSNTTLLCWMSMYKSGCPVMVQPRPQQGLTLTRFNLTLTSYSYLGTRVKVYIQRLSSCEASSRILYLHCINIFQVFVEVIISLTDEIAQGLGWVMVNHPSEHWDIKDHRN